MSWPTFTWNTYIVSHIWYFSGPHVLWPWIIFKCQIKYNWVINGLYRLIGAYYHQCLHDTHIVSHIYGLSVDLIIFDRGWPWFTLNCQIRVIDCLVSCISLIVYVTIWICVNNVLIHVWLPVNYGSDFEQYLNQRQLDPISLLVSF